ncbi:GIY-YIG nuclease family protein [Corynebacterium sp.]|uniref:GIY-YIG nuclease family protein n=1 Tax=Corynebacterium sp. TaxID=1720 RepID=UPI0026DF6D8E|nr:GIY-YIG nuclease family protein [Corynebacterium sp.]MDO5512436.1 GIY-YIG nuclease family protein [Corynebacterium sp.]
MTEPEFHYRGVAYDVRDLGSIQFALVQQTTLRGVYRLTFADGHRYVGQSVNVVSRFARHRRTWDDITTLEFFPFPHEDLDRLEKQLITATERGFSVRNIRHANRPGGDGDVSLTVEEGVTTILPWDRQSRTRPQDGVLAPSQQKFVDLLGHDDYELIRAVLGWYLYETIPDPVNTQRHLWVVSCLPSTNRSKDHRRLAAISCGSLETIVVHENMYGGEWGTDVFINTSVVPLDPSEARPEHGFWMAEEVSYRLGAVTRWEFSLEALFDIVTGHLDMPLLSQMLDSAYELNVRLLRGGGTMFRRFHNEKLAAELITASMQGHEAN